jgi:putative NADPH-quinone reductase
MARRIVIIQGHPDPAGGHLCHALAEAYAASAAQAGHAVESLTPALLRLPLLETKAGFEAATEAKRARWLAEMRSLGTKAQ